MPDSLLLFQSQITLLDITVFKSIQPEVRSTSGKGGVTIVQSVGKMYWRWPAAAFKLSWSVSIFGEARVWCPSVECTMENYLKDVGRSKEMGLNIEMFSTKAARLDVMNSLWDSVIKWVNLKQVNCNAHECDVIHRFIHFIIQRVHKLGNSWVQQSEKPGSLKCHSNVFWQKEKNNEKGWWIAGPFLWRSGINSYTLL